MKVWVGTSGFQYQEWAKNYYPADVPQKRWLEYYAERFNTVEINNSFYRLPAQKTFAGWHERTPAGFRFAVKGSRYITHRKRLSDPEPHIRLFFERAEALSSKLAVVLWQLPANFKFDREKVDRFCSALRRDPGGKLVRQALEARHDSWFEAEAVEALRGHNVALVIAHSKQWPYRDDIITADFLYARFHGAPKLYASNYSDRQLRDWADKLKRLADGRDIYAYFNNDADVHAPRNAQQLREFLS